VAGLELSYVAAGYNCDRCHRLGIGPYATPSWLAFGHCRSEPRVNAIVVQRAVVATWILQSIIKKFFIDLIVKISLHTR